MGRYSDSGGKITKKGVIAYSLLMVMLFGLLFWLGKRNREKEAYIKQNGIETVGTVTRKSTSRGAYGGSNYHVYFEFEHNGETFRNSTRPTNREQFNSVEVGERFKVIFLPCRPQRDAVIFLDRPVTD